MHPPLPKPMFLPDLIYKDDRPKTWSEPAAKGSTWRPECTHTFSREYQETRDIVFYLSGIQTRIEAIVENSLLCQNRKKSQIFFLIKNMDTCFLKLKNIISCIYYPLDSLHLLQREVSQFCS